MDRLVWVGAALLLCACSTTNSYVRKRFATEQSCPESDVKVDDEGGALYRARGCDKETTYACGSTAGFKGGIQCEQQGLPRPPGYHEPEHPVFPPPDPRIVP
jgi:hypothetical protein